MIVINNINEMLPYLTYVDSEHLNNHKSCLLFTFKKDEEFQDVTFNCDCDLKLSFENVANNLFNVVDFMSADPDALWCEVKIVARDVVIKSKFSCNEIICRNIMIFDEANIDLLGVEKNITAKKLSSLILCCDNIICDDLQVSDSNCVSMTCKKIKVDDLNCSAFTSKDVSFEKTAKETPLWSKQVYNSSLFDDYL